MEHLSLNPDLPESFKQKMLEKQWVIIHQDAGQTHLVGWGYEIRWQKAESMVILRYSNKQGVGTALLEMSHNVFAEIQALVSELNG